MTTLYYPPKFDSGLAGAKLYFYQTGTSTPQNTYTDEALAVASSNPVVADADGVFAKIYLDPKLPSYRVLFTTSADVTIYQVDNVPSNQNIQQAIRLEATNPYLFLYDTDGTANSRKYRIRAAGAAFEVQSSNDAESVFTTILQYTGGILYSGGTEVAVTSTGSFTGTVTGFASNPTGTVYWRKVNNMVHMWSSATLTATSNAATMTMTGLPAACLPVTTKGVVCAAVVDNGTEGFGRAQISSTEITFAVFDGTIQAFTSSGTKGLMPGWCITYSVD